MHDLNHDLTFYAHTFKCVCHSIRSMFGVLGVYNFEARAEIKKYFVGFLVQMRTRKFAFEII